MGETLQFANECDNIESDKKLGRLSAMKRYLSLLLVIVMLLSLAACNRQTNADVLENAQTGLESTAPSSSQDTGDDTTVPTTTVPVTTTPEATESNPTDPAPTEPKPTEPKPTEPKPTEPKPTTPAPCAHSYGVSSTVPSTCQTKGSATYTCSKCGDSYTQELTLAEHTVVTDPAVTATCTTEGKTEGKHCSVCSTVLVVQQTIGKTSHSEVIIPGTAPTETADGMTEGKKCSVCNQTLVAQTVIPAYLDACRGDYAYTQLGAQANGSGKQKLYERLLTAAKTFHNGQADAQDGIAFSAEFSDLGLTEQEAIQVWLCFRNDNPLFYWISGTVSFTDSQLNILVDSDYATAAARANYNKLVYQKITEYINKAAGETSAYMIALAYHDAIIEAINYAYEEDGFTPEDAVWAHNILGVFEKGSGVCEAYARTFQLLLNVSGVENTFVSGTAGTDSMENHAWNLVKLDDGRWYWCDLTWDDNPTWEWGIVYNYFCVNDTQNVNWTDVYDPAEPHGFLTDHTPCAATDSNLTWQMEFPSRSEKEYKATNELLVRDTFSEDELTYSVIGYHTVQLIDVDRTGALVIPETVEHNGVRYTVISVGQVREDGLFDQFTVLENTTSVTIPKTVKFIWDFSLDCATVEWYKVDSANPYFTSVDGVLFTKSLYTLIAYPSGAPARDRYVIPDATVRVANGAFTHVSNPIKEVVIGPNVEGFGFANWGTGYWDAPPTGGFGGNVIGGEFGEMIYHWNWSGWELKFTVSESNQYLKIIGGVLYTCYEGKPSLLEAAASTDIASVLVADGVTGIERYAFENCKNLTGVTLPSSIQNIADVAFNCPNLKEIIFLGTVEQWIAIGKSEMWSWPWTIPVICTDGTVT